MRSKAKIWKKIWVSSFGIWVVLNLILPQLSVGSVLYPRTIHPFFSWRLFSDIGAIRKTYMLEVESCTNSKLQTPVGLLQVSERLIWLRTFYRINYLGDMFEKGQSSAAKDALRWYLNYKHANLSAGKCRVVLYWFAWNLPAQRHYVEESRLDL